MNDNDSHRWNARYAQAERASVKEQIPLSVFAAGVEHFPVRGRCLEIACGQGEAAVWLARRGMTVHGVDVSSVAIGRAQELAAEAGVHERCYFEVFDLEQGLPDTLPVDLLLCHNFRDPRLYGAMIARLRPGGMLAIATLSEVEAEPGRFRAKPGELRQAFAELEILDEGETAGRAWLAGCRRQENDSRSI